MMMNPPLPPPPPPPPSQLLDDECSSSCHKLSESRSYTEAVEAMMKIVVAVGSSSSSGTHGHLVVATPILQPILQVGPVCGLVALAETGRLLSDDFVDPDAFLRKAIESGMTKNGEMFSVNDMKALAEDVLPGVSAKVLDTTTKDMTARTLIDSLLRGKLALIPYDADHNHTPSLRNGVAAHWAVVNGIVIPIESSEGLVQIQEVLKVMESGSTTFFHDPSSSSSDTNAAILNLVEAMSVTEPRVWILAHHGKSKRTACWNYDQLLKSNQNLTQVSPKILTSTQEEYICGDIKTGLCSKLLIIGKIDKD